MRAAFSFAFVAVNALCGFFAQASPTLSRNGELGLRGVSAEGPSLSKRTGDEFIRAAQKLYMLTKLSRINTVTYSATITARNYDTGAAVSDIGYLGPYYEFVTSSTSATVFSFTLPTGATSGTGVRLTAVVSEHMALPCLESLTHILYVFFVSLEVPTRSVSLISASPPPSKETLSFSPITPRK